MQLKAEQTITIEQSEAAMLGTDVDGLLDALRQVQTSRQGHDGSIAVAMWGRELCGLFDEHPDAPFVVVCLPGQAAEAMPGLIESTVEVTNGFADDLSSKDTYLMLKGTHHQLLLNTRGLPAALDHAFAHEELLLLVYCGTTLWARRLTIESLGEGLIDFVQGAEMSSRENYRPYREFTAAELRAAERRAKEVAALPQDAPCYLFKPVTYFYSLKEAPVDA